MEERALEPSIHGCAIAEILLCVLPLNSPGQIESSPTGSRSKSSDRPSPPTKSSLIAKISGGIEVKVTRSISSPTNRASTPRPGGDGGHMKIQSGQCPHCVDLQTN